MKAEYKMGGREIAEQLDLFGDPIRIKYELDVIPVSVIDLTPQKVREEGDHNSKSSRQGYSPFPAQIASLCFEFFNSWIYLLLSTPCLGVWLIS